MTSQPVKSPAPQSSSRKSTQRSESPNDRASPWVQGVALFGLLSYLALYYASPVRSLPARDDGAWRRVDLLGYLLAPEMLWLDWTGGTGVPSLAGRGPVACYTLAIVAVILLAGGALTRLIVRDLQLSRAEHLAFSAALGASCVSTLTLAIGLLGGLQQRAAFWALDATLAIAGTWILARKGKLPPPTISKPVVPKVDRDAPKHRLAPPWLCGALVALFATFIVLGAMLPPVEFDVREYHLQAPREFFRAGQISFLPHNVYANMPLGFEMLSLHSMALCGDAWQGALVGKTLIALFACGTAWGVFAVGQRWWGAEVGALAATLFISIPWVARESMAGLIDVALGGYALLALHAALLWRERSAVALPDGRSAPIANHALVLLSGLLAGSAVACKYPALVLLAAPLGLYFLAAAKRQRLRVSLVYGAAVTVACGLWFAKNAALTGNPVYPLAYDIFGGLTRDAELHRRWVAAHAPHGFGPSVLLASLADVLLRSDWLSPLLWPLALLATANRRARGNAPLLTLGALATVYLAGWWLFTHRIDRFWLPLLPPLALLAAVGAQLFDTRWSRAAIRLLLTLAVGTSFLYSVIAGPGAYNRFFLPLETARRDPLRVAPWHVWLNDHVPPDQRVLTVGDAEVFDLEPEALYDTPFDPCRLEQFTRDRTPDEIRRALAEARVSHVLVRWDEIARYRSPGNYGYSPFVRPEQFDDLVERGILTLAESLASGAVEIYACQSDEDRGERGPAGGQE